MKQCCRSLHWSLVLFLGVLLLLPALGSEAARNVILMIGDGMGFNQVAAARFYVGGHDGRLHMDTMPYTAIVNTTSRDSFITDSAAGGTALSCGVRTNNGMVAMVPDPDSGEPVPVETILQIAKKLGRATGLVTTTEMTHATPAVFGAHAEDRGLWDVIARQYLTETQPEILLGGGLHHFLPPSDPLSIRSPENLVKQGLSQEEAENDQGLLDLARQNGYQILMSGHDLEKSFDLQQNKVLGLFAKGHLPYELERTEESEVPKLREMVRFALNHLDQHPEGFFLMVEGGRIDHAGHASWNDFNGDGLRGPDDPADMLQALKLNMAETLEFDQSIAVVLEWLKGRDDTLVIVTADHETGGLELIGPYGSELEAGQYPEIHWASTNHTANNVPAYAIGVGAERVRGYIQNTEIFDIMKASLRDYSMSGLE